MSPPNPYLDWRISRWATPASDFVSARRELLQHADDLCIILQSGITRDRVRFVFSGERLYRNINETYLTELARVKPPGAGVTWKVEGSDFWRGVMSDPLAEHLCRRALEYVLVTEDDVIQVISRRVPVVDVLAPADPRTPLPGLSHIVHRKG